MSPTPRSHFIHFTSRSSIQCVMIELKNTSVDINFTFYCCWCLLKITQSVLGVQTNTSAEAELGTDASNCTTRLLININLVCTVDNCRLITKLDTAYNQYNLVCILSIVYLQSTLSCCCTATINHYSLKLLQTTLTRPAKFIYFQLF